MDGVEGQPAGNLGKWNDMYSGLQGAEPYGDVLTYQIGADFLSGCSTVEDWGCGKGWFRQYVDPEAYRGIDGSLTPHADEIVDLVAYRSDVDGIFLRHVLEHNDDWRVILENALDSARSRLVLVLFTPLGEQVRELAYWPEVGVPDLSLPRSEILELLCHHEVQEMRLATATHYGEETVFLVSISR